MKTIQEVQIIIGNYNAECGRSVGGQVRMATKSGTRDFHGTVYDYLRNDKLDANAWKPAASRFLISRMSGGSAPTSR